MAKKRNLLAELIEWFMELPRFATVVLFILTILSAFGVVSASHETRNMYRELQVLQKERDDIESEYGQLLLEQSAWANNTRVDQIAREELQMVIPKVEEIIVLRDQVW
ncbi:MAG: cell division protein FtsL [Gammaproteobacteria bacterium]|nr:cell division protein FtsL [Gammaproteobacteria bacterium]